MRLRALFLATIAAMVGHVLSAWAQDKTLYVAGSGGSMEKAIRSEVFPSFAAKQGIKLEYVAGNSTDVLAKLQAQKGNQQIDVAIIDDGPMAQAVELGFCRPLALGPVVDDLYELAKFPDGKSIAFALLGAGIVYSKEAFAKNNWPAPTSWNDLADPKFKGKIVIPPLNNTYGVITLVQVAKTQGGSETNIDPGFAAFKTKIGPNVLAYEPSPGKMTELLQSGQAALAVWGSSRAKALADSGFASDFAYPKEGGVVIGVGICPVAGGKESPEAQAFIAHLLSPEMQVAMSKASGLAPVNKKAVLPPENQLGMPYGPEQVAQLKTIDWVAINRQRDDWNKRWVREIER
jgi:putative spermidine/putrescine transport system substrate-binding protein